LEGGLKSGIFQSSSDVDKSSGMDPDFDVGMAEAGAGVSGDTNGVSKSKKAKRSIESIVSQLRVL
jgi:hypothetical protein